MLGSTLENGVGRYLVIQDHSAPAGWFPLGADHGAQIHFAPLFQNFKQDLHLSLICNSVQQKVIQDEQCSATDLLEAFLVLGVVLCLECDQRLQK